MTPAKVCDGGAGLHPLGGAEGGAKVAFCEGILRCPRYWKVRRPRSYQLDDCPVGVLHSGRVGGFGRLVEVAVRAGFYAELPWIRQDRGRE